MKENSELRKEYIPIKQIFLDILKVRSDAEQHTDFQQNQGNLSISFFDLGDNNKSFWITLGKKRNKLEWKHFYYLVIDNLIDSSDMVIPKPDKYGKIAEQFSIAEDIYRFESIILAIYDYREMESSGQLFDCCHRYLDCSDAKDCIHPDMEFQKRCTYRRKLKQGIIFFGKNRNVD